MFRDYNLFCAPPPTAREEDYMTAPQRFCIATGGCLMLLAFVLPRVIRAIPAGQDSGPAVRGKITEFTVPTPNSFPAGITEGADGNMWFVENTGNNIATFSTRTHDFLEYRIPTPGSFAVRVVADRYGNLWFTESAGNQIGEFTIATRTFHEYRIPTSGASPFEIALSDTGVWFTEQGTGKIGNLSNGVVREYSTPTPNSDPVGLTPGDHGAIWFAELAGNKVGKFDTRTQTFTEYPVSNGGQPFEIVRGPHATFWFTIQGNDGIGRVTNAGEITRFAIPTAPSRPYDIALGPDGAFWFEEGTSNKIGRITPQGRVTNEYPIPTPNCGAHALTASPRLGIWFTEIFANKIASITAE
jgi:virginiamycin B lyase